MPGKKSKKRKWLAKKPVKIRLKKRKFIRNVAEGVSPLVTKYWFRRYDLFSKYDEGIKMDEEGWFSVTPEEIAIGHAKRCGGGVVIDCFAGVGGNSIQFAKLAEWKMVCTQEIAIGHAKRCGGGVVIDCFAGVGGNSIQFAKSCSHVIAIDIDPQKIELAYNNAKIYGVEDHIDFIVGDFIQLAPALKGDVIFLSPPWGGPSYKSIENFTLDYLKPKDGYSIFQIAQTITPNIIMYLPRNVALQQLEELSWLSSPPLHIEIEENFVNGFLKGVTAYFGEAAE